MALYRQSLVSAQYIYDGRVLTPLALYSLDDVWALNLSSLVWTRLSKNLPHAEVGKQLTGCTEKSFGGGEGLYLGVHPLIPPASEFGMAEAFIPLRRCVTFFCFHILYE